MTESLLCSLAYLKINSETNNNGFLKNFLPILEVCLKEYDESVISISKLKEIINCKFGLKLPTHVLNNLLSKARKEKFVRKENNLYYVNYENIDISSFLNTQKKVERIYKALIQDFIFFSKEKYNVDFNSSQAEETILSFLSYNQIKILKTNPDENIIPEFPPLTRSTKIITSDYFNIRLSSNPTIAEYIETIVKGYMIANALYFPSENYTKRKFLKTKFYFDTSFLIYALGYSGIEYQLAARELLELLYKNGARLYCFSHNFFEIQNILHACSNNLNCQKDGNFGRSIQHFVSLGYTRSDIQLLISQLKRNLETLRIEVINSPEFTKLNILDFDEEGFTIFLKEKINYLRIEPLEADVKSFISILRLRTGDNAFQIEDCKAIFITSNYNLANACNEYYFKDNNNQSIPPFITDFLITNIMWLKSPLESPDLPIKRIIADCYAAIQPDYDLMYKWINEIEKLKSLQKLSEEDYYFLRFSPEAKYTLVESTLGDLNVITEGSVPEILEKAKNKIIHDSEEKAKELENEKIQLHNKIGDLKEKMEFTEKNRCDNLNFKAKNISHIVIILIRYTIGVLLLVFWIASIPFSLLNLQPIEQLFQNWPKFILSIVLMISFVVFVLENIFGRSLSSILNKLEINIHNKAFLFLVRLTQ